jgi:hypothetical protein
MKKLFLVFATLAITLFGCKKQASDLGQLASENVSVSKKIIFKGTAVEFTSVFKVRLPMFDYGDGNVAAKGKKKASEANIAVWAQDLTWLQTGATKQITVSENAQWVGITNFASTTSNDGATVPTGCNGNYNSPPGAGATFTCDGNGSGFYRGFTSDYPELDIVTGDIIYNVHTTDFNQQL